MRDIIKNKKMVKNSFLYSGIFLLLIIGIAYCQIIYWNNDRIDRIENISWTESDELKINIDTYSEENDSVILRGWCVKTGADVGFANYHVVVHCIETDEYYRVNTGYERRDDVTVFYNDGFNYGNCGFFANRNTRRLKQGTYDMYLWYKCNGNNLIQRLGLTFAVK